MKGRLAWAKTPRTSPLEIAERFVQSLGGSPGIFRVWAEVSGHTLRLTVLARDDREVRRRVYAAERETRRAFQDAFIELQIIHEGEWMPPQLEEAVPVYRAP